MNTTLGTMICALGGLAGAVFALPFRGIRGMKYESYWFVYAIAGLVVFPFVLAASTCPNLLGLIGAADGRTLACCIGFGALWGLGGLAWGLMIRYLGIGLGLAVGCGLCSATGTLVPPIVTGHAADLVADRAAVLTLVSVIVSLLGIVLVGLAGKLKEGELDDAAKQKAVAEFDFRKGMLVAIFSGIASAGMNFGLQSGGALQAAAAHAGVDAKWTGMPVLVVVLWGGFLVNAIWCLWQNAKNGSFGDYLPARSFPRWVGDVSLAGAAGVVWAMQFACQKIGEPAMGDMAYIAFAVVMGSCVFFSSLIGIILGEWRGTGVKTKRAFAAGLLVLAASIVLAVVAKLIA
ncbi:MAG: L-rhamnose/proton symporter RhaT [Kiritimatiellia bacterium]